MIAEKMRIKRQQEKEMALVKEKHSEDENKIIHAEKSIRLYGLKNQSAAARETEETKGPEEDPQDDYGVSMR